ncbi:unnamed protein product [Dibothriocephalus latus]|uniref:Uncharacterized protein n=1 Tax=Dibothriocephalus latus TaxID=60516 RepID=A0A3P6UGA3_DIBLA|nr:unnamed protein product [Dibothriocephalus latus]
MIAAVESLVTYKEAMEETNNLIRHRLSPLIMAYQPREVLSMFECDVLRALNADRDIVTVPTDKERYTIALDRKYYLQKAKSLLEDRQFHVPWETSPLKKPTHEIILTLLALENSGAITSSD